MDTGPGVRETGVQPQFHPFLLNDPMGNSSRLTCLTYKTGVPTIHISPGYQIINIMHVSDSRPWLQISHCDVSKKYRCLDPTPSNSGFYSWPQIRITGELLKVLTPKL